MKKNKVKNKDEVIETFDFMKTNKDNIKNIIKNKSYLKIINELSIKTNKIVIHAYGFIKLYCLYVYENNEKLPTLDKNFISDVFKVITQRKCGSGGYRADNMPLQLKKLTEFYKEHYSKTINNDDILYYDKMSYILAYEAIDMVTNINNNIQEHFLQHLNKFVNISYDIKNKIAAICNENKSKDDIKQKKNELYKEIRVVKNDLLSLEKPKSNKKYHKWIKEQRKLILPDKNKFDKDNILYDIKSNTSDYLKAMIYIGKELEKKYDAMGDNNRQIRLFNILPLRTNIVQKYITIDTAAFIQNFLKNEPTTEHLKNYKKDNNQEKLWSKAFRLDKRVFKKNKYAFNYMIKTDGISASILFIRLNNDGTPMKKTDKNCKVSNDTKYIEKIEITDDIKNKRIVAVDPNVSDILYCGSKNKDGKLETFRYTQNQRRLEIGTKKYSKIMDNLSKTTMINDKTIKELETELSEYNSKTSNYSKFVKYLVKKNEINNMLFNYYEQELFRKFKLNRFINTQKSESKMIKNFENKFGDNENTVFVIGDYDRGDRIIKGCEPTILKRSRQLFKNAGYPVYLVNEFRTSKLCNGCHGELEKFMVRESHRPRDIKQHKKILVNGLLQCTSVKPKCELIHNRDKNAVQNMLYIVDNIVKNGERPKIFTRSENSFPFHDGI